MENLSFIWNHLVSNSVVRGLAVLILLSLGASLRGQTGWRFNSGSNYDSYYVPRISKPDAEAGESELSACEEVEFFKGETVYKVFTDSREYLWVVSESGVYRSQGEEFLKYSKFGLELAQPTTRWSLIEDRYEIFENDDGDVYFLLSYIAEGVGFCFIFYDRDKDRMCTVQLPSLLISSAVSNNSLFLVLEGKGRELNLVEFSMKGDENVEPIVNISLNESDYYYRTIASTFLQGDSLLVLDFGSNNFLGYFFDEQAIRVGFLDVSVDKFDSKNATYFQVNKDELAPIGSEVLELSKEKIKSESGMNSGEVKWEVQNGKLFTCKNSMRYLSSFRTHDDSLSTLSVGRPHLGNEIADSLVIASVKEDTTLLGEIDFISDSIGNNWLLIRNMLYSWNNAQERSQEVSVDVLYQLIDRRSTITEPSSNGFGSVSGSLYSSGFSRSDIDILFPSYQSLELLRDGFVMAKSGLRTFLSKCGNEFLPIEVDNLFSHHLDNCSGQIIIAKNNGLVTVSPRGEIDSISWESAYGNATRIMQNDDMTWVFTFGGLMVFDSLFREVFVINDKADCYSGPDIGWALISGFTNQNSGFVFDGNEYLYYSLMEGKINVIDGEGRCNEILPFEDATTYVHQLVHLSDDSLLTVTDRGVYLIRFEPEVDCSLVYQVFSKSITNVEEPKSGVFLFSMSDSTGVYQTHWFNLEGMGRRMWLSKIGNYAVLGDRMVYSKENSLFWKSLDDLSVAGRLFHRFKEEEDVELLQGDDGAIFIEIGHALFLLDSYTNINTMQTFIYCVPFAPSVKSGYHIFGNYGYWSDQTAKRIGKRTDVLLERLGGIEEEEYERIIEGFYQDYFDAVKKEPFTIFEKILVSTEENKSNPKGNRSLFYEDNAILKSNENDIEFTLGANYHINPQGVTFSYKLENWDDTWSEHGKENTARYQNLTPGTYTFKFFAMNEYGRSASEPTTFTFTIRWPWYKTWTAWSCFLLGFLSVVYATARYYINDNLRIQMAVEQEREKTRERLGDDFHDNAGQDLTKMQLMLGIARNNLVADVEKISADLAKMQATMTSLTNKIRDFTWSLKTDDNSLEDLCQRLKTAGFELFSLTDIEFVDQVQIQGMEDAVLSPSVRQDILLIFREVMNNCVKYSEATMVLLQATASVTTSEITISFMDNGIGFNPDMVNAGVGMDTLRKRTAAIGGKLKIEASIGQGVKVTVIFTH